jgi:hypothetical protein
VKLFTCSLGALPAVWMLFTIGHLCRQAASDAPTLHLSEENGRIKNHTDNQQPNNQKNKQTNKQTQQANQQPTNQSTQPRE